MTSLLPPNATNLEKNIVASFTSILDEKELLIKQIYDVNECPAEFLVYLAWFFNVDFSIYNELNESAKRQYIQKSIEIHRKKGTLGALKQALELNNYLISVTEWYENSKTAHTARINITATDDNFDLEFLKQIVAKNKNVQTIINYLVSIGSKSNTYVGMACRIRLKYKIKSNVAAFIQELKDLIIEVQNV